METIVAYVTSLLASLVIVVCVYGTVAKKTGLITENELNLILKGEILIKL